MCDTYLTPWPGPQLSLEIRKLREPGPIETQSSPVWIVLPVSVIPVEDWTPKPSVFGLFPGATSLMLRTATLVQPLRVIWDIWLFIDFTPLMTTSFAPLNVMDYNNASKVLWDLRIHNASKKISMYSLYHRLIKTITTFYFLSKIHYCKTYYT